jgi:hypothetical protein
MNNLKLQTKIRAFLTDFFILAIDIIKVDFQDLSSQKGFEPATERMKALFQLGYKINQLI